MRRKGLYVGGMAVIGLLLLLSSVMAATAPTYAILDRFSMPYRAASIAVDSSGSMYVTSTDINAREVFRYASDGSYIDKIALNSSPLSLHIAANGILYIGELNRIVAVSGSSSSVVASVGKPVAIASDAGFLYVLDANSKDVKKINLNTNAVSSLNLSSYLTGDLTEGGIAVDGQSGEVYVLDKGEAFISDKPDLAAAYKNIMVWRVQVFDSAGNFVRKFSKYIDSPDGKLASAKDIAVDGSGRVYLSDYLQSFDGMQGVIGVFDGNGNHLLTMPHFVMATKLLFANNRLYAVTGNSQNRKVSVVGIDKYAILDVDPRYAVIDVQGTYVAGNTKISLSNSGTDALDWVSAVSPEWVSVVPSVGTVDAGAVSAVDISVNAAGRSAGQYYGSIDLSYDVKTKKIPVVINVYEAPILTVAPSEINVMVAEGASASRLASVSINNDISNSMVWTASSNSSWLTAVDATGSSNAAASVQLNINAAGLTAGTYTGAVTFTAAGAIGSGSAVTVNLTVVKKTGISVNTNNADAAFTVTDGSGTVAYSGSGLTWSVSDVPAGTYTVTFGTVSGFITPNAQVKTLSLGQTISFSGIYQKIEKSIVATVSSPTSTTALRVYNMSGNLLKNMYPFKGVIGGLDTAIADVDGDGNNEIIVGIFNGSSSVKVLDASGHELASATDIFGVNGVRLASADFDHDGKAEVVALSGSGQVEVKVLDGTLAETGASFMAYGSRGAGGTQIAAGDVDGDGTAEIVTVDVQVYTANLKVWKVITAPDKANWAVILEREMSFNIAPATTVNPVKLRGLTIGNVKGEAAPMAIIGFAGGRLLSVNTVNGLKSAMQTSGNLTDFDLFDVNDDGMPEIIVSSGVGVINEISSNGAMIYSMPVTGWYTLRISVGDLGNAGVK